MHLFDVDVPNGPILKELNSVEPGNKIEDPIPIDDFKLGLGICYDIRFPELALRLRKLGSDIITFPSAFTTRTGKPIGSCYPKLEPSTLNALSLMQLNVDNTRLEQTLMIHQK